MTETKFNIAVLVKLAIDTRQAVGGTIMNANGTMNRAALPAVFNPDDKHALEVALRIKRSMPGTTVTAVTMGADNAAAVLKEAIYIGADKGILVSDRKFAGADTLATSYILARALKRLGADMIIAGRQTIDGDTGQVGPQVAEWLGVPQVTYVTKVCLCSAEGVVAERLFENRVERVSCPLPAVLTVDGSSADCRNQNIKRYMTYKHAGVERWSAAEIGGDETRYGLGGSPTLVSEVKEIAVPHKEAKSVEATDEGLKELAAEIISNRIIG